MNPTVKQRETGTETTWWGLSVDKWVGLFQSVGFPTLLVAFLLYTAWCYLPPVVQGHVKLLERTGDTLESMDKTLKQSNAILDEVNEVEQSTKTFMEQVMKWHKTRTGAVRSRKHRRATWRPSGRSSTKRRNSR